MVEVEFVDLGVGLLQDAGSDYTYMFSPFSF